MTRTDYLLRFRRCKRDTTLEFVFERLWDRCRSTTERADMVLAKCQREREIEQGRLLPQ